MAKQKYNRKSWISLIVTLAVLFIISAVSEDVNPFEALVAIFEEEEGSVVNESTKDEEHLTPIEYEKVTIDRVVDGDTFVYKDESGEWIKVRLIGVNTPESVKEKKYEFYGKESSKFTHEMLEGQVVYLERDVEAQDQYGRELRYVWLEVPYEENLLKDCFNALLIDFGYARAVVFGDNDKYYDIFKDLEQMAKNDRIGMWQER